VFDAKGGRLELEISSRHLEAGMAIAEKDDIELGFSGKSSLAMAVLSDGIRHYFAPFTEV